MRDSVGSNTGPGDRPACNDPCVAKNNFSEFFVKRAGSDKAGKRTCFHPHHPRAWHPLLPTRPAAHGFYQGSDRAVSKSEPATARVGSAPLHRVMEERAERRFEIDELAALAASLTGAP